MSDVRKLFIDGTGSVFGRLASHVAKQALLGKEVVVVNCDEIVIIGNKSNILEDKRHAVRERHGASLKGPRPPRKDTGRVLKRTVRGMLTHKQGRGLAALKRVMCYPNTPAEYKDVKKENYSKDIARSTITLREVSKTI